MVAKPGVIKAQAHLNFPSFLRQREWVTVLDAWTRGEQQKLTDRAGEYTSGHPYTPRSANSEYKDLMSRTPTPWGGLIVTSLAQTAYVDGIQIPGRQAPADGKEQPSRAWERWQQNGMDARQIALHRDTIAHGLAFGLALPATDPLTGRRTTLQRGVSAREMAAFYDDDVEGDEWPSLVLRARPYGDGMLGRGGWTVRLYDDEAIHYLSCTGDGEDIDDWTYISYEEHPAGVPPVVQFSNQLDLSGRATGEIEPVIPLLRRIDQTTFDRLIVQRFGAWKVRYIAGLAKPEGGPDAEARLAMKLTAADFLAVGDPNAKLGTLDSTDIKQFIEAGDTDLRYLSAVRQIPPHHLLGLSANLQAEALAAAEAGLQRKSNDFKTLVGESHEKFARLSAHVAGDTEEAQAYDMQVRWRDTESRSFAQTAQALGVVATTLKVPVQMLWEKLPGWTDADSKRALELVESGAIDDLLNALGATDDPNQGDSNALESDGNGDG